MPLVTLKIIKLRTAEEKRNLIKNVAEAIAKSLNCPLDEVRTDIIEYNLEKVK